MTVPIASLIEFGALSHILGGGAPALKNAPSLTPSQVLQKDYESTAAFQGLDKEKRKDALKNVLKNIHTVNGADGKEIAAYRIDKDNVTAQPLKLALALHQKAVFGKDGVSIGGKEITYSESALPGHYVHLFGPKEGAMVDMSGYAGDKKLSVFSYQGSNIFKLPEKNAAIGVSLFQDGGTVEAPKVLFDGAKLAYGNNVPNSRVPTINLPDSTMTITIYNNYDPKKADYKPVMLSIPGKGTATLLSADERAGTLVEKTSQNALMDKLLKTLDAASTNPLDKPGPKPDRPR